MPRRPIGTRQALAALKGGGMKRLVRLITKSYGPVLVLVVVCILISSVADAYGMLFLRTLIDQYILPLIGSENPDYGPLARAIGRIAAVYLMGVAAEYTYNRVMVNVSQGTMRRVRTMLFEHMESLPVSYFDQHTRGDIMSIYTNDTDTLRQFIGMAFPQLISCILSIASTFVSMCILNIPLTAISVLMTAGILFASGRVASLSGKYFGLQQRRLGEVNGYIEEMMAGAKVVKVFSHEHKSIEEFREKNEALYRSSDMANAMANVLMPIAAQLGNLDYVVVAVVGASFAIAGRFDVTIGVLVAFLTLNRNFNRPFTQISMQLNSAAMAAAGADRIFALLDEPSEGDAGTVTLVNARENADGTLSETDERTGVWAWKYSGEEAALPDAADPAKIPAAAGSFRYRKLEGSITMDHVYFGYLKDKTVLHDICLYAKKGQKIAFVGSTGAGKTTITNLLNRFYEIQKGTITFDGIDIREIRKADLRHSLGIVLQETDLFTETVMENIRFGRIDATDEECIAAARLANADGFIRRLPQGYQTLLTGNGANLSQGQRQLIAIARAAVADPPVLILDEATSSIDTRTEHLVQRGMDSLMEGRTTFVIAHRLSTVRNADCIMVLEGGRIIERGNHEELMAEHGKYYRLCTGGAA